MEDFGYTTTILLALENGEPLDRVVFAEVMFDHSRGISGEIPEHIEWVYSTAIPKLEAMGVKVDVVRAERDYVYFFANAVGGGAVSRQNIRIPHCWDVLLKPRLQGASYTEIS